jgi:hypothetical protein
MFYCSGRHWVIYFVIMRSYYKVTFTSSCSIDVTQPWPTYRDSRRGRAVQIDVHEYGPMDIQRPARKGRNEFSDLTYHVTSKSLWLVSCMCVCVKDFLNPDAVCVDECFLRIWNLTILRHAGSAAWCHFRGTIMHNYYSNKMHTCIIKSIRYHNLYFMSLYFAPTCFNRRGSSSGGSMPVPG